MNTRSITYLSIVCLILILASQAYIVYDYYRLTENSLKRETNAILNDSFRKELNSRMQPKEKNPKKRTKKIPPPPSEENTIVYDFDKMRLDKSDLVGLMNTLASEYANGRKPFSLKNLDSITGEQLKSRNIKSDFSVLVVEPQSGKVLESSKKIHETTQFLLYSNLTPLDFEKKKSIQLVLINPMASIFKRMGGLLAGSFVLTLICLYGLWFLFLTLSRQKKLSSVKNDFFGHTAHELKRPVAQLYMALDALSRPSIDQNPMKKERYLTISKEATKDMSEKIGMIMTLSMAEEGVFRLNFSEFDIAELITAMKDKFIAVADKEVTIEFNESDNKIMVNADKDHITQCIANLIDNAIKYSKESVKIAISVTLEKKELILRIKDNGIGIPAERVNSVFEKYNRINTAPGTPAGFGIGLSYVKTVIDKHAGRILVTSELTKGTEFSVYLPA